MYTQLCNWQSVVYHRETADVTTTQQQDSESSKFDKLLTPVQDLQPRIYSIFRTLMRLEEKHMNVFVET